MNGSGKMQRGWKDANQSEWWGQSCLWRQTSYEDRLQTESHPPHSWENHPSPWPHPGDPEGPWHLISISIFAPLCLLVERKPIMLFVFRHIYFYPAATVLILQRFLICYFICPPELREEHQHCLSAAHRILGKDKWIWVCGDLSSAPSPLCLLHAPPPHDPCLQKIFHLDSDAWFLPWSEQVGKCSQAIHTPCPSY